MSNNLEYTLSLKDLFTRRMNQAIASTEKLDKRMESFNNRVNKAGNNITNLGKKIAAAFVGYKVIQFGKDIVDSLSKYELFLASIKTMLHGDVQAAMALNAQLVGLAKTTPFSLEDVQKGTKQLMAYGFAANSLIENMRMLGDVSAGVGAPLGDIVYLYGTLRTQGRAFTKDIYQFTGRGIPIIKELAKQFKTTESNIMDMAKEGKIGFKEVEKAFKSMTSEGGMFFKLMEEQSKTVGGRISNLGDSWEQLKINIGKSQSGIIANTISWASNMVDVLNKYFSNQNDRDHAIRNIEESRKLNSHFTLGDENRDKQYAAYKGTFKSGERKYFETDLERKTWMQSNPGYKEGETIGTQERFNIFSNKMYDRFNAVAELDSKKQPQARVDFLRDLLASHKETMKLMKQNRISTKLAENQFAVINDVVDKVKGLARLNTVPPVKPEAPTKPKNDGVGTGIETSMSRPQNLYISIEKLVESMNINTTNINESMPKIKEMIERTLIEAVNDVNYMDGR